VPLYSLSAGNLGTSAQEVEAALGYALELCHMWNAMLLLDEADVFLNARTSAHDGLARNELVSGMCLPATKTPSLFPYFLLPSSQKTQVLSLPLLTTVMLLILNACLVFLTKLEYYQGIVFLTTNRIVSIDQALQSRVDLFLPYHALDGPARRQVWENFINHIGTAKFKISSRDLDKLAEIQLNGREIKNLIKTAQLLSLRSDEGRVVTAERLYALAEMRARALEMLKHEQPTARGQSLDSR
jgi:SpoVK/Ycf46/Vps4 family AAA+-type ATPase